MNVSDPVEVHVTFTGAWSAGFEVAAVVEGGYQVRRLSDGALLPAPTSPEDIRAASTP
jgi:hypothetical protein